MYMLYGWIGFTLEYYFAELLSKVLSDSHSTASAMQSRSSRTVSLSRKNRSSDSGGATNKRNKIGKERKLSRYRHIHGSCTCRVECLTCFCRVNAEMHFCNGFGADQGYLNLHVFAKSKWRCPLERPTLKDEIDA